jgi:dTDP-4-amino-4,6-dideoxygalactose transaminase
MKYRIPLSYNAIPAQALAEVLKTFEGRHHNELISGFERKLAAVTGSPHAVALNSGTAAIHLGLKALGVQRGDEVIVSTFTYVGSINPIIYLDAKPVFIDSELQTWNMDPALLETAINERMNAGVKPKVILVVHAYGMPANMKAIMAIAKKYEIAVLEDAAEALGSRYHDQHLGTLGDIGIISFNTNKTLTTYGGGALLTKSPDVAHKIQFWSTQSREDKPFYEHRETGYSYRIGPLNAACGLAGLKNFENNVTHRRNVFKQYQEALRGFQNFSFVDEPAGYYSNRWLSTLLIDAALAQDKVREMAAQDIETRPLWNPMHAQPAYMGNVGFLSGVSDRLFSAGLALPSGDGLTEEDISEIVAILRN